MHHCKRNSWVLFLIFNGCWIFHDYWHTLTASLKWLRLMNLSDSEASPVFSPVETSAAQWQGGECNYLHLQYPCLQKIIVYKITHPSFSYCQSKLLHSISYDLLLIIVRWYDKNLSFHLCCFMLYICFNPISFCTELPGCVVGTTINVGCPLFMPPSQLTLLTSHVSYCNFFPCCLPSVFKHCCRAISSQEHGHR